MRKHWLILLFLMVPAVVLGVGSVKRIINLPGFTTDRVLIVNTSGEIDDTAVSETELNLLDGVTGTLVTEAGTATLTNKTIDADGTGNSITNIENADIKAGAAIDRTKIANGTADHVVINNGSGTLSSEATLSKSRGGAGADMSSVTFPTAGTIITESSTSTLTNKTIDFDSNTLTNVVSTDSVVDKNFWSDYQAVTTSNVAEDGDYTTYAGTPDNSAAQLSVSSETTDELSGTESYSLDKAAGADASGQAWILELDAPDRLCTTGGNTHYLTFKYETSANYDNSANERVELFTYGNSSGLQACNARDTLSGTFSNNLPVAPNSGQYQCTYSCDSADTQIDVVIAYTGTATNAVDIVIDEIRAGPDAVVTAPIVTEWQEGTMVINGSVSNPTKATTNDEGYFYRRVGDELELSYFYRHTNNTGTAAGSGVYQFQFPSEVQCTVDTTKIETSNGGLFVVGSAAGYFGGSDNESGVAVLSGSGSHIQISIGNNAAGDQTVGSSYRVITNATIYYAFKASVPCQEYGNSNAILSTTQQDHRTIKAIYEISSSTANNSFADATYEVADFDNQIEDTHSTVTTGSGWVFTSPASQYYDLDLIWIWANTTNLDTTFVKYRIDGSDAGFLCANSGTVTVVPCSSTTLYLAKGQTLDITAFQDDSTSAARAPNTTANARPTISIKSNSDFSTSSTYGVFQVDSAQSSTKTPSATNHYHAHTGNSVTVDPGTWKICGSAQFGNGGLSPGYTTVAAGIFGANGADSSAAPAQAATLTGVTELTSNPATALTLYAEDTVGLANTSGDVACRIFRTTQSNTFYLVTYALISTASNARITVAISKERLQ